MTIAPDNWMPASDELVGKTILVTGATGGIGRAVSLACAAAGAEVVTKIADLLCTCEGRFRKDEWRRGDRIHRTTHPCRESAEWLNSSPQDFAEHPVAMAVSCPSDAEGSGTTTPDCATGDGCLGCTRQCVRARAHPSVDRLAESQHPLSKCRPAVAQRDLKQSTRDSRAVLRDVCAIRDERERVASMLGDVRLEQDGSLSTRLLDGCFEQKRRDRLETIKLRELIAVWRHDGGVDGVVDLEAFNAQLRTQRSQSLRSVAVHLVKDRVPGFQYIPNAIRLQIHKPVRRAVFTKSNKHTSNCSGIELPRLDFDANVRNATKTTQMCN